MSDFEVGFYAYVILVLVIASSIMFVACASTDTRIQSAIDKMVAYEAIEIEGSIVEMSEIKSMDRSLTSDKQIKMKAVKEDVVMAIESKSKNADITTQMYLVGDVYYIYIPFFMDRYVDSSEILAQLNRELTSLDLMVFNFEMASTEIEIVETTILFQGGKLDVLEVKVALDDDQMTEIIKEIYAQLDISGVVFLGIDLNKIASVYESIEVESAEYTLYIDKKNDVKRYNISAVFDYMQSGQLVSNDMQLEYNIIDTGASVNIELPDIAQNDIITLEELNN